ncbi:unnamed protein product [Ectocarpus sp. 12 AP-2014]
MTTNQDDFDMVWPDPIALTHYDWAYSSNMAPGLVRNVFRAYWSMSDVWGLMAQFARERRIEYDTVVLSRPDVWFHVDIDLPRREFPLPDRTVFVPSFGTSGTERTAAGTRTNDRFAYGSVTAMRVMMNRIATFMQPSLGNEGDRVSSENVLALHLQANNITVQTFTFPMARVRLTGVIPFLDHGRVRAACNSGTDPVACDMVKLGFRCPN